MPEYSFERETRTSDSETFIISADASEIGRADIHYGLDVVYATLCVPDSYSEDDIQDLIGELDERLVITAHPYREDFVVTVWLGRQAGVYSEDYDEEEEEDVEGNGHRE
jgi:hypothetical protein